MPLLLLPIAIGLAWRAPAPANGFLDGCPIDRQQRLGATPVVDILETFYKDLVFVGACTAAGQRRQYSAIIGEIAAVTADVMSLRAASEPDMVASVEGYELFSATVRSLQADRLYTADRLIYDNGGRPFIRDWVSTYFYYFEAEVKRLIGDLDEAAKAVLWSFSDRRESAGVSMNELERLDGLLMLHKVLRANKYVDRLYGLRESPNYALLDLVHLLTAGELGPLRDARATIFDRLFRTEPKLTPNSSAPPTGYDLLRLEPGLDDAVSEHSAPADSVERILCEFARKLNILAADDEDLAVPDYRRVMRQVRELDAELAREFERRFAAHIDTDSRRAARAVSQMWADYNGPPHNGRGGQHSRATFLAFFHIELNLLQSPHGCNVWRLEALNFAHEFILKDLRREHRGLSMDKLAELDAKVVLHWLRCFHERVKLAFELAGDEDDQQLRARRAHQGASCHRILPDSSMLRWNLVDE